MPARPSSVRPDQVTPGELGPKLPCMKPILAIALLILAACGGGAGQRQQAVDLDEHREGQFADPELCERAVDNFEKAVFEDTSIPAQEKGLFRETEKDWVHRDRVIKCTRMTRRQARCIAEAPSMQYIRNCERFAELQ